MTFTSLEDDGQWEVCIRVEVRVTGRLFPLPTTVLNVADGEKIIEVQPGRKLE